MNGLQRRIISLLIGFADRLLLGDLEGRKVFVMSVLRDLAAFGPIVTPLTLRLGNLLFR